MSQGEIKPHDMYLSSAIYHHSQATISELKFKIYGDRQHIEEARESHREFRRLRRLAVNSVHEYGTEEEIDQLLDSLDSLPRLSPASTLLDNLTGADSE